MRSKYPRYLSKFTSEWRRHVIARAPTGYGKVCARISHAHVCLLGVFCRMLARTLSLGHAFALFSNCTAAAGRILLLGTPRKAFRPQAPSTFLPLVTCPGAAAMEWNGMSNGINGNVVILFSC
ncbi:hypothetical protein TNIN_290391 [Trichonephila inaurata madagascariensis]|uniref:Uncharacterized protein n=1 Tax=Trichonephila inaurata madagascariensis TaxID=2747483 RepID=A0A8X6MCP5_9ARAC|nr:hypothetical protein TNIN_290391 [Trichonephila inaurata madagascariensis]